VVCGEAMTEAKRFAMLIVMLVMTFSVISVSHGAFGVN
jgi:hypothetical protein